MLRAKIVAAPLAAMLGASIPVGAQLRADPMSVPVSADAAEAFKRRPGVIVFRARAQLQAIRFLVIRSPLDSQGQCTFESASSDPGDLPDGMEYIEEQIATDPDRCETLHQAGFRPVGNR